MTTIRRVEGYRPDGSAIYGEYRDYSEEAAAAQPNGEQAQRVHGDDIGVETDLDDPAAATPPIGYSFFGWNPFDSASSAAETTESVMGKDTSQAATSHSLWGSMWNSVANAASWVGSFWSGTPSTAETTESEPMRVEAPSATAEVHEQPSYMGSLSDWGSRVWNWMTGSSAPTEIEHVHHQLTPLSPQDRAELEKLLRSFNRLLDRISQGLNDADLEELMELVLMLSQKSKKEEFALVKTGILNKQQGLKNEHLKQLKDWEVYAKQLQANKMWGRFEQAASALLGVTTAAITGPTGLTVALFYGAGKLMSSYMNDPITHAVAGGIAKTGISQLFGREKDFVRDEKDIHNVLSWGFLVLTTLATYPMVASAGAMTVFQGLMTSVPTVIQGLSGTMQRTVSAEIDATKGRMELQAFTLREAREGANSSTKDAVATHKSAMQGWKTSARHARSSHEASTNMFR